MTKASEGKMAGDLKGGNDVECYVFAMPDGSTTPLLDHVIYKVAGERTARGLCELFRKRPSGAPEGIRFCYLALLSFSVEEQIVMDEVLDCLDVYGQSNPGSHAAQPSAEVLWRAQCAARASKWDRRLREKLKAERALRLEAMVQDLAAGATAGLAGHELSAEEKLNAALRILTALAEPQALVNGPAVQAVAASATSADTRHKIGRFEYRSDFGEVWVDGQRFDLTSRVPARRCLQYLVENQAFDEATAREFTEIHTFVTEQLGSMANEPRIHHYFNDSKRKLTRLRSELIKPVARTGRYYLAV